MAISADHAARHAVPAITDHHCHRLRTRSSHLGARDVEVDATHRCYLGGSVDPLSSPVWVVAHGALSTVAGGGLDGFLARLSADGRTFEYAGYLGGARGETINALARDPQGRLYVTGPTFSYRTFPIKTGPNLNFNGKMAPPPQQGSFVAKIAETAIIPSGTGRIGTTVAFSLLANDDPGLPYQAGTSLGTGPIRLGSRTLALSPDPLLSLSVSGVLPGIFDRYRGRLDARGTATARLHLPKLSLLVGRRLHTAFVTQDPTQPFGVRSISNTVSFSVVP